MKKPKPKLLTKDTLSSLKKGLKKNPFTSRTKKHTIYSNSSMSSETRKLKPPVGDGKIEKEHRNEREKYYRTQTLNEATALEQITKRAPKLIKEGKIRIVPGSIQRGPGSKVVRWAEYRHVPSLRTALSDPHTKKERKKELYMDLARQIGYLHSVAKYAHNDLRGKKNSNIILWDGKNPYPLDWGISKDLTLEESPYERMGKDVSTLLTIFEGHLGKEDLKDGIRQYLDIVKNSPTLGPERHNIKMSTFMKRGHSNLLSEMSQK